MAFSCCDRQRLPSSWFVMLRVSCRTNNSRMRLYIQLLAISQLVLLFSAPVFAAQLSFKPSLELRETYTDNVGLTDSGEDELITEINPGIAVQADGNRLNANLGFTLQNIFYAKDSGRNDRFHDLAADASAELVKDFAFLNLRASDSQRVTSPTEGGGALDNLNTVDRTAVSAWMINPYFEKRFGRSASGSASYSFEARSDGQGASDAEIEAIKIGLESGPSFRRMTWSLGYSSKSNKREAANNYSRESSTLRTRYKINRKFGVLFRAGIERNDLSTSQNRGFQNGSYYAAGVSIIPHSTLRVDLLSGDRLDFASVTWVPSLRSALYVSRQYKSVGLNPGEVWKGNLRLVSRRMSWLASYMEDDTSAQELQSLGENTSGGSSPSAIPPTDGLFRLKHGKISWAYKTAKSLISVAMSRERREPHDNTKATQKSNSGDISWRWHFAVRTTMLLRFEGLNSDYPVAASGRGGGERRSVGITFFRKMKPGMEGSVMARNTSWNGLEGGSSYDENRLRVGLKWSF